MRIENGNKESLSDSVLQRKAKTIEDNNNVAHFCLPLFLLLQRRILFLTIQIEGICSQHSES